MKSSLRAAIVNIFVLPPRSSVILTSPRRLAGLPPPRAPKRSRERPSRPEIILDQTRAAVNLTFRHNPLSAMLSA
jgi:hypothetical protein